MTVQANLTATYAQVTVVCDDGPHVVNGSMTVSGQLDVASRRENGSTTLTASLSLRFSSASLVIDGVPYNVNLVYGGNLTYPGTWQATISGTVNGETVSQSATRTLN
jgi:hypothetical protein